MTTWSGLLPDNMTDVLGPEAMNYFEEMSIMEREDIRSWALALRTLDADAFLMTVADALLERSKEPFERTLSFPTAHVIALVGYREAKRRHKQSGHGDLCEGDTLYSLALNTALEKMGEQPIGVSSCTCIKGRR